MTPLHRVLKLTGVYVVRLRGDGHLVIVSARKTWAAGRRMTDRLTLADRGFGAVSYVNTDPADPEHGTVTFFDLNGEEIAAPVNA